MENSSYKINLTYNQVLDLVRQLPKKDKAKLSNELAKEAVDKRLTRILNSFSAEDITQEEINHEVEEARTEIYAKKQKI